MHRLVASSSACLLVLHMVLGCCWHHLAHAAPPGANPAVAETGDDCCCAESHGPAPDQPTPGGHAPSPCQHDQCTFTVAAPLRSGALHDLSLDLALEAALPQGLLIDPCGVERLGSADDARYRAPHVPLRLLYSTLLI